MKNRSLTTTWSANGCGRKVARLPRRRLSLDWRPGRFFCMFGRIGRESSTMSCSPMAKRSIRPYTANNWSAWMQHSCKRDHLWSTEAELSSIRTTPGHTHLWWRARSSGSSDGRLFCIHRIVRISHQLITTYFCPWRTSLVVGSWSQESPVKIGSSSFLTIGKYYEVGISLGTRHQTKWRIYDLNYIIVTNFMSNWKFNKNTARLLHRFPKNSQLYSEVKSNRNTWGLRHMSFPNDQK